MRTVRARTGLDVAPPWIALAPDPDGVRHVAIPLMGRVQLALPGHVDGAYLRANGGQRPLPPGSHLDALGGSFTWAPGPGYLGTYGLVFVIDGDEVPIDITIQPHQTRSCAVGGPAG